MRSMLLAALLLIVAFAGYAVVRDEGEAKAQSNRIFRAADVVVRGDGRILVGGLATKGDPYSEEYGDCGDEGPATRDFAVVHLSRTGRIEGHYSATEAELEACATHVEEASLDRDGALRVAGKVHEPPGLSERIFGPGDSGQTDRWFVARFAPEGPFDGEVEFDEEVDGWGPYASLRLPNGDWLAIGEDPSRQRRTPEGLYYGTLSLARFRERPNDTPAYRWSFPLRAISPKADLEFEDAWGWELWADERGFYGFAHYPLVSSPEEAVLFRHRPDGRPDTSFGDRGRLLVAPEVRWLQGGMDAMRVPGGDFVVVAGLASSGGRVLVRRYAAEGRPVEQGSATIKCGIFAGVDVQVDGKLVLACVPREGRGTRVVRLLPSGRLDPTFGRNGRVVIRKI